jgi:hypothetical protein
MRGSNGRFQKGQTGNAGGRPKVTAEVRELARGYGADAITGLAAIAADQQQPAAARVAAYNALLDRGYGKPHQESTTHIDNNTALTSDAQREAENARLLAELQAAMSGANGQAESNGEAVN